MDNETKLASFKALGDPTRLHVVELLSSCCCTQNGIQENGDVECPTAGEVCCHITGAEKITSTISHHLHELEAAGLIKMEKKGKTCLCNLNPEALEALAEYLMALAAGAHNNGCCCSTERKAEGCCDTETCTCG